MAKKKRRGAKSSSRSASITELTKKIDRLDRELLKLISQRAELHRQLGVARHEAGKPRVDLAGELRELEHLIDANKGPLPREVVQSVFRELISGSRALVKPLKVAYLGPKYSYSHLAALERFGGSADLMPAATIAAVFEEINRGQAEFGLAPIENSTDGRVVDTLGMFARLPLKICGEVELRIHHYLLGKCARAEVQEVYSKPQALSQCRQWLAKHLPQARLVEMASTAAAAQLAAEKPGAAAIASRQAGVNYGLDVIEANVEDNPNNITRFAVIGEEAAPRTGKDKTALMFEIAHKPGALADAMNIFKRNKLNLTWIESFPIVGSKNEYLFFVECVGHMNEAKIKRALDSLARKTVRLEVLGSYAQTDIVG